MIKNVLTEIREVKTMLKASRKMQRMSNLHNKAYWTVEEFAWYLNAKIATIYSYTHKRLIPYHKANGFNLFKRDDVYAFIEKNRLKSIDEVGGDIEALMLR